MYNDTQDVYSNLYLSLFDSNGNDLVHHILSLSDAENTIIQWIINTPVDEFEVVSFNDDIGKIINLLKKNNCQDKLNEIYKCEKLWL
ncbi:MAG: hypothetical protein KDH96_03770 [Candidatus Riesia sp.]|nr:hypothetical protein [Candidatus Riesia sp.]